MKLNYQKIFELFSSENLLSYNDSNTTYQELRDHPVYFLGMYKKILLYREKSKDLILDIMKKENIQLDKEDLLKAENFVSYNKAWGYISKFDLTNKHHLKSLKHEANDDLCVTLQLGIKYFESTTEYEKCGFLKKILDEAYKSKK